MADKAEILPLVPRHSKTARRVARFRQIELERTVKAMRKAGLDVAAIKVEPDGTFIVIPGTPETVSPSVPNPWDGEV